MRKLLISHQFNLNHLTHNHSGLTLVVALRQIPLCWRLCWEHEWRLNVEDHAGEEDCAESGLPDADPDAEE